MGRLHGYFDLAQKLLPCANMTSVTARADQAVPGRVIAQKYRLDCLLGEGGMGSIWQAFNLQLELPVAIKLLRSDLDTSELAERLRIEARAAAKLAHPSIVRVFDIGETPWGEPFIVMELLRGESLADVLERGALAPTEAVQLLLPIADALALAHSRGVIHRDLKPENIFLATAGSGVQPKLLDFGIAKVMSVEAGGARALTQTGTLLGSPDYMSPEQAYGHSDIDERTDIWSFCVVLYEALTGSTPFQGDSCPSVLRSVVRDEPASLEAFAVDPQLAALIARGLRKERSQRPASILELGQALAAWLASRGVGEDATGTSLETKWLGHAFAPGLPVPVTGSPSLESLGEQATLRSVPSPRAASRQPLTLLEARRPGRRILSAAVVVSALAGGAAWASWDRSQRRPGSLGPATLGVGTNVEVASRHLQPSVATPAAHIAVDVLPVPPRAVAPLASANPALALKSVAGAQASTLQARAAPLPPALPRALPARNVDLINPY